MRTRPLAVTLALLAFAPVLAAQGFMGEVHRDLNQVQTKFVNLAKAIPAEAYDWRPAPGVRSIREVFLHVASDNYLLPALLGTPVPAGIAINPADMKTLEAYEKRALTKDQVVADLEASFGHLHRGINVTTDANLAEIVKFFGQDFPRQRAMLSTVTHLHEHLGQAIAYARSNNVVPPWSR